MAIPKKIRRHLGKKFIIAKWYEGCLVAVSHESWQELLNRLTGASQIITSPVRDTDRFIMGSAFEVVPDEQGRIIIPEKLAQYAGFKKEVLFMGLGNRVEIWDQVSWEEREKYIAEHSAEFLEEVAKNGRNS